MARRIKNIPGQLSLFEMDIDTRQYVAQANTLVGGKQALKINSATLIRAARITTTRTGFCFLAGGRMTARNMP